MPNCPVPNCPTTNTCPDIHFVQYVKASMPSTDQVKRLYRVWAGRPGSYPFIIYTHRWIWQFLSWPFGKKKDNYLDKHGAKKVKGRRCLGGDGTLRVLQEPIAPLKVYIPHKTRTLMGHLRIINVYPETKGRSLTWRLSHSFGHPLGPPPRPSW